jgi:hypothetical protein
MAVGLIVGLLVTGDAAAQNLLVIPQPRATTDVIGGWLHLGESGVSAPSGAKGVLFLAFPSMVEASGSLISHFDDLYLVSTPIFADGFELGNTAEWTSTVMVFVTEAPYFDADQIEYAGRTFCEDGSCPWGPGMHDGVDFVTDTDLVPFRSSCNGAVSMVDSFVTGFGHRQVNVIIELEGNPGFGLVYAFEPMIQDLGDHQEANIVVSQGDEISAGDLIGRLVMSPAVGSHVHWGVLANHQQVCPRPYLADAVESSLLDLIREDEPAGEICY